MKSRVRGITLAIVAAAVLVPVFSGAVSAASDRTASQGEANGRVSGKARGANATAKRVKAKAKQARAKRAKARAKHRREKAKHRKARAKPKRTAGTYNRWKWFKNTYWIVPQRGIYSIVHADDDKFAVARGQTVFHITDYFNGYWTGVVTVKITRALVPTCQYVLGQVTPEGRVHMTMYDSETGEVINYPIGTMVKKRGEWTMVNEMTSDMQGGGTLSHWAYMVQSKRGDRTFRNLPFAHESIPEFMSACPKGPPILHKPKRG